MKRKRGEKRPLRWLRRIAILLFVIPVVVVYLAMTLLFFMLRYEDASTTPEGSLNGNYAHYLLDPVKRWGEGSVAGRDVPAYTILQEQRILAPPGLLYVLGWYDQEGTRCLALTLVQGSGDYFETIWPEYAEAHCSGDPYSIDWFLEEGAWYVPPYAVVYGFSGNAEAVEVKWGDGAVSRATIANGVYAAMLDRRPVTIKRVDFISVSGEILHGFTPRLRLGMAP